MPNLLLGMSAPSPSTPADSADLNGMRMRWEGWDGSIWDVCDRRSGVFLLSGLRGLGQPTGVRFRNSPPGFHGSQHRGTRWNEREVFWPVKTWHEGKGTQFIERDRAFFDTMDPERVGRWVVVQPDGGEERHLELRYDPEKSVDDGVETIPSLQGWARYALYLMADQPFWVGKPSVKSFDPPRPEDPFFDPNGPGLFNIGQGFTTANASIDNLGDVESYGRWYVDGETAAGAWVGVGSRTIAIPFAVPAGHCLVIESDPTKIGAVLYQLSPAQAALSPADRMKPSERVFGVDLINPVNRSKQLGASPDFAPVAVGRRVKLAVNFEGNGVVELNLPSLYKRAW
ncbi:hypothetical protein ASF21_12905 [Arthrobacter sp. Leaf234]|uniref:hypothetical protein n=1 Tax=Arthrobacter sp. Leaf234 TaxID=1736303 RepID=UPI0006FF844A|nr:hypothetical protein [Arthrobacter sp. Leaf234]KQN99701.1 hypothetical protein ASF21_12905 [Arthrobacter sp. Leaf234]